jgi:hypothetical protein
MRPISNAVFQTKFLGGIAALKAFVKHDAGGLIVQPDKPVRHAEIMGAKDVGSATRTQ